MHYLKNILSVSYDKTKSFKDNVKQSFKDHPFLSCLGEQLKLHFDKELKFDKNILNIPSHTDQMFVGSPFKLSLASWENYFNHLADNEINEQTKKALNGFDDHIKNLCNSVQVFDDKIKEVRLKVESVNSKYNSLQELKSKIQREIDILEKEKECINNEFSYISKSYERLSSFFDFEPLNNEYILMNSLKLKISEKLADLNAFKNSLNLNNDDSEEINQSLKWVKRSAKEVISDLKQLGIGHIKHIHGLEISYRNINRTINLIKSCLNLSSAFYKIKIKKSMWNRIYITDPGIAQMIELINKPNQINTKNLLDQLIKIANEHQSSNKNANQLFAILKEIKNFQCWIKGDNEVQKIQSRLEKFIESATEVESRIKQKIK